MLDAALVHRPQVNITVVSSLKIILFAGLNLLPACPCSTKETCFFLFVCYIYSSNQEVMESDTRQSKEKRKPQYQLVVSLTSVICLLLGFILGSKIGSRALQDFIDEYYGYRWNYLEKCIIGDDTFAGGYCRCNFWLRKEPSKSLCLSVCKAQSCLEHTIFIF